MPTTTIETRSISAIAREIKTDWKKPYFGAVPYIEAMRNIDSVNDMFDAEDGKSIVLYFLSNAASWRGEVAKRVKAELKTMIATKKKA